MRFTTFPQVLSGLAAALVLSNAASAQCPAPDAFEENDDCLSAVALTVGNYPNLSLEFAGGVAGEDEDFYSITVPHGEMLQIDCLHLVANGDIDTYLYDASSPTCGDQISYLAQGYTSTDDETMTWSNLTGAPVTYIIEVEAWDSGAPFACNDYTLNLSTSPDPCVASIDDSFEPNDACGAAVPLASGLHTGLFTAVGDEDYYLISVPVGEIVTVDVTYGGITDVDIALYSDLACTTQEAFSFSFGGAGQVTWGNSTGAPATIVLHSLPNALTGTCNNYDLNVSTAPDPCLDPLSEDSYEDNDDCVNAIALSDGLITGLFTNRFDQDFFKVTVADLDTLTVNMYSPVVPGDIDIHLYDSFTPGCGDEASYLVRGWTSTDDETMTWTNNTGSTQTYFIQVALWDGSAGDCNFYDLEIIGSGGSFATAMCFGDGAVAACPCGNESALGAGEGCSSSVGTGAILTASGSATVAADDLTFTVTQARPNQTSMLLQGATLISVPFKDGRFCMGNPTERIQVVFLDGSGSGSTTASVATEGNVSPGDTRYYQHWFRDPGGVSPCGNGSNFSNGLTILYN